MLAVMAGEDAGDPCAAPVPVRKVAPEELRQVRIGYFEDDGRTPVTGETGAAVRTAAQALDRAGFVVAPFRPQGLERVRQLWWKFFGIAGGMLLRPMVKGREADLSPLLKEFLGWTAAEPEHTGESLLAAWCQRDEVRAQVLAEMKAFPVLLCPAAAVPAFRHGERSWEIEGRTVRYLDAWSYTEWFNLLGTPAAVVPVGQSGEGLPIGVQIVGGPWEEEVVLALAGEVERECGGFRKPPREFGEG
jgi:Asp-tRNA(Asn)/Glu-tRNA(Gln) amidotransferase A subunit family amidase